MKNGIAVALLFVGLISVILGIVCFSMENGAKEFYYSYGGDAYTGMQQAAAQGANNGYYGNNIMCLGFGSVLMVAGMVIMLLAINSILKNEFGGGGSEGFAAPVTGSSASAKPVHTSDFTIPAGADFKYTVNDDGSVCIMKYVGKTSAIRIPENLFGKSVTSLGDFVFSGNRTVTGIIVPDSVTSIGNGVFGNCAALSRIILSEGLTAIVNSAFFGCRSLTDIHIPESVTFIDQFAFTNCVSLKEIRIPGGVTSIGDNAFSGCPDLTLVVTPGSYAEQYCKDNGLKYRYAD